MNTNRDYTPEPLPKGYETCPRCDGNGCYTCGGHGLIPEAEVNYEAGLDGEDWGWD